MKVGLISLTFIDNEEVKDEVKSDHAEEKENHDSDPYNVAQEYVQDQISEENDRQDFHHRKYSSPPGSIYEDTTEDGRIRMSEDGAPLDAFSVSDPVKGGAHVTYTVKGYDEDGPFEGAKRYNDFYNLRAAILTRWPGIYVPPIPPKKAVGNKEDRFLDERKHFLERFLLMTSKMDHIMKSDEFRLFSRPSGEIDKAVQMLPAITPDFLLERYKNQLEISEEVTKRESNDNKTLINDYQSFIKNFMKTLKFMRDSVKQFVTDSEKENMNYRDMMDMLMRFEQNVLLEY
jgi:hypothetical protein